MTKQDEEDSLWLKIGLAIVVVIILFMLANQFIFTPEGFKTKCKNACEELNLTYAGVGEDILSNNELCKCTTKSCVINDEFRLSSQHEITDTLFGVSPCPITYLAKL